MSVSQVCEVLSRCGVVGPCLQQTLAPALEICLSSEKLRPLLWLATSPHEGEELAQKLHQASRLLYQREGRLVTLEATKLYQHLQNQQELQKLTYSDGSTLFVHHLEELPLDQRNELWHALQEESPLQNGRLWLIAATQQHHLEGSENNTVHDFFGRVLWLPPLYERGPDIDALVCDFSHRWLEKNKQTQFQGFSLEAVAHIHRAVLQTRRLTSELLDFLDTQLQKAAQQQLPTHEGHIVAWTTVRALEDTWGYRMLGGDTQQQDIQQYDFQERLFAASLEYAAWKSPFSRELLELQTTILRKVIDEIPHHQRNYQGITAHLDHLLWLSMKLLSGARTQAELRDFFGFGTDGKIPKATAKLKFDQYQLDQYGFRPNDPLPWSEEDAPGLQERPTFSVQESPHVVELQEEPKERERYEVSGEIEETLFLQHQDLLTVLTADSLTLAQIATLFKQSQDETEQVLRKLADQGLLEQTEDRFGTPSQDLYYMHTHSKLRFMEENLSHRLGAAFQAEENAILDNQFLRLPEGGLPQLRKQLLDPFVFEQLLPRADSRDLIPKEQDYEKGMYALVLLGTNRLNPQIHSRTPLRQRVLYYFREACLQRADQRHKNQAICLQATLMLTPEMASLCMQDLQNLRKQMRQYLPQGRGNKPNFNLTYCFTEVPLSFQKSERKTKVR